MADPGCKVRSESHKSLESLESQGKGEKQYKRVGNLGEKIACPKFQITLYSVDCALVAILGLFFKAL